MMAKIILPHPLEISSLENQHWQNWQILSNHQPLLTPKGNPMILPSKNMAEKLQAEAKQWHHHKKPAYQLFPRICYVLDYVMMDEAGVLIDKIISYSKNDLLCYRIDAPEELAKYEQEQWQKWLDWARINHKIDFKVTFSIEQVNHLPASLAKIKDDMLQKNAYQQAGFLELVEILGSIILSFAIIKYPEQSEEIFACSMLHENYQAEKWGATEEYQEDYQLKYQNLCDALEFYQLSI